MECWGKGSLEYWSSGAKADWKDKRHWRDLIFSQRCCSHGLWRSQGDSLHFESTLGIK